MPPATGTATAKESVEEAQVVAQDSALFNDAEKREVSSFPSPLDHGPLDCTDMTKEKPTDRRIKAAFVLAIVAASMSLAGQQRLFGLSELHGFVGAIASLFGVLIVSVPQLRKNFRATR